MGDSRANSDGWLQGSEGLGYLSCWVSAHLCELEYVLGCVDYFTKGPSILLLPRGRTYLTQSINLRGACFSSLVSLEEISQPSMVMNSCFWLGLWSHRLFYEWQASWNLNKTNRQRKEKRKHVKTASPHSNLQEYKFFFVMWRDWINLQ